MVAISLSVRALLLTVAAFASVLSIEHPVEDYARVFKLSERDNIARRMSSLTTLTDVQMAVLTVRSLNGQKIEVFAHRAASAWGGGGKDGKNNGLLLVIAPKEHRIRLEVGAGLAKKLTNDRVQPILDSAASMLKVRLYETAVLDIINGIEPILRSRSPIFGTGAVAAGGLATAAAVKVATSGTKSAVNPNGSAPLQRDATAQANPLPAELQFPDQAALDSFLMKKFFLLLSFISLILGLVFGRSRMRQEQWSLESFFSYVGMIAITLAVSWVASVALGSPRVSPAVLTVTLVQAFSGMRVALATHLKRIVGPDSDFELVPRVTLRELSAYVLPSIVATFVLGAVLGFSAVHHEQLIAIVGTAVIGVGHAMGLYKLDEALAGRPLPPLGSFERICTSPIGRLNNDGVHVHVRDDSTTDSYQTDSNANDNRGSGGKFDGNGTSSQW